MLKVDHLSRRYGDFKAVSDASFAIQKGEIVGLLGHNGAGKTTIMKMLSGYLEPHSGSVEIDGLDLTMETKQAQRGIGYLPENLPIYSEMLVADYLDYAAELKGLSGEVKTKEVKRAISATQIEEKVLATIGTLSRGFKQRVGVAQAILGQPKLLILDEPTNGLDPAQTEQMRLLIRSLSKQATVILSTHIMQEVDALCDRVLILHRGRLAVDARLDELRHSNRVLLCTSLDSKALKNALDDLPGLNGIAEQAHSQDTLGHHYVLSLDEGQESQALSAVVAKRVLEAGGDLYQLQTEKRDLESVFSDVAQAEKGELNDAA